jgi:hypothetical protein
MVQQGVAAIVGPDDASVAAHVQSMAEILKVPHIETRLVESENLEVVWAEFSTLS